MALTEAKLSLLLKSAGSSLQSFWADPLCAQTHTHKHAERNRLLIPVLIVFTVSLLCSA